MEGIDVGCGEIFFPQEAELEGAANPARAASCKGLFSANWQRYNWTPKRSVKLSLPGELCTLGMEVPRFDPILSGNRNFLLSKSIRKSPCWFYCVILHQNVVVTNYPGITNGEWCRTISLPFPWPLCYIQSNTNINALRYIRCASL